MEGKVKKILGNLTSVISGWDGIEAIVFGTLVAVSPEGWFVRAEETKLPRGLLTHTSPGPDADSPLAFIPVRKILMATVGQKASG